MILILLAYVISSITLVIHKLLLQSISPLLLTGIIMTGGGMILLTYHRLKFGAFPTIHKRDIPIFIYQCIFGVYLNTILRYWGVQRIASTKAFFIYRSAPLFAALLSYLTLKEKLTLKQWIGLFIGFVGLAPLLYLTNGEQPTIEIVRFVSLAELAVLGAVILQSHSRIILRQLVKYKKYTPAFIGGTTMLAAGILALLTSYTFEQHTNILEIPHHFYVLIGAIFFLGTIRYNLFGNLLKKHTATLISFAGFSSIIIAAILGKIIFNESITWHYFAAGTIIFIGLYLFYIEEKDDPIDIDNE